MILSLFKLHVKNLNVLFCSIYQWFTQIHIAMSYLNSPRSFRSMDLGNAQSHGPGAIYLTDPSRCMYKDVCVFHLFQGVIRPSPQKSNNKKIKLYENFSGLLDIGCWKLETG